MPAIDLADRPIVISGASSGIGRATALACASAGMPVTLAARRADRLESLAQQIINQGAKAIAVPCDVADQSQAQRVIDATIDAFGSIYAVFANAGYAYQDSALGDESRIRALIDTNLFGSLNLIRPAIAHMQEQGRGHVLFCSSCLSKIALPNYAAYCATKAMQEHFARALRLELNGTHIHVSSVHPIATTSELRDRIAERSASRTEASRTRATPKTRAQPPQRVARAVVNALRHPRAEVWTSVRAHAAFRLAAAFPGLGEWVIRRRYRPHHTPTPRPHHEFSDTETRPSRPQPTPAESNQSPDTEQPRG